MKAHFVKFYFVGSFVNEDVTSEISSWDIEEARQIAKELRMPFFAFEFFTRERTEEELDSRITARSARYYLGGKIETLEEIEDRGLPKEAILLSNMRTNNIPRVVRTAHGTYQELRDGDIMLEALNG